MSKSRGRRGTLLAADDGGMVLLAPGAFRARLRAALRGGLAGGAIVILAGALAHLPVLARHRGGRGERAIAGDRSGPASPQFGALQFGALQPRHR